MPLGLPPFVWWGGVGLFAGAILFNCLPWIVAPLFGVRGKQRVGDMYTKLACRAGKRNTLIERKTGGLDLRPTRPDGEKPAEGVKLDGDQNHITNDLKCIGWLHNRQFGLSIEDPNLYTDALWAEYGSEMYRDRSEDAVRTQVEVATQVDDQGKVLETAYEDAMSDKLVASETPKLVRLSDTKRLVGGDAKAFDAERGYEVGKKSQEGYWQRLDAKEAFVLGISFLAGGLLVWFVFNYGGVASGGGGDPTTILPGMLAAAGVTP